MFSCSLPKLVNKPIPIAPILTSKSVYTYIQERVLRPSKASHNSWMRFFCEEFKAGHWCKKIDRCKKVEIFRFQEFCIISKTYFTLCYIAKTHIQEACCLILYKIIFFVLIFSRICSIKKDFCCIGTYKQRSISIYKII